MNNDFCPRNCPHLNMTEKQQVWLNTTKPHICTKYDVKLYHLLAHPDLYRCEQCYKENQE
jgi:hypothetical protein